MKITKSNHKTPAVEKELITWLEVTYPDKCPDPEMTDREIWMAVGEQVVIRKLRALHEDQLKKALGSSLE